ncbi:VanZ-like family protein [Butyrivibrio proteoclasticus B316]|uniref:VanZ-like family protein n=1 Tax=Butyrivibrio proteoclasticus (strain ATCC 51982 / DSM 14932 / B316) TaxID=515622 RepID=E0RZN6_BUTPB|nr:VanZ family protein [Butyrivibrio proteoclasticus]ADL35152.1 VanZ-like family protein [Butyrivibrio proteoclasticus B316]
MGQLKIYFDYFIYLTSQQMDGASILLFIETSVLSVLLLYGLFFVYEKVTGRIINSNKKRALWLMAIYACFIFQIAFYRRLGMEKSAIHTRIYFGFRKWDGTVDEKQVVYSFLNVVFFIPWGFLIASALDNNYRRIVMTVFYSLITSLIIEVAQYFTRTGASEATDLVTNACGGFIGCLIYIVIKSVYTKINILKEGNV